MGKAQQDPVGAVYSYESDSVCAVIPGLDALCLYDALDTAEDDGALNAAGDDSALTAGADPTRLSIGIVIDLHYLQVAASSFSLATSWSVPAFEEALVTACGGGEVTVRLACDSTLDGTAGSNGMTESKESKEAYGKARLHAALREAGYRLILSPNKGTMRAQGATDCDIACCIFEVAGAFAMEPRAQVLALVAGDADFRPALSAVLTARPALSVAVVAERALLSQRYLAWIESGGDGEWDLSHIPLGSVLAELAPSVVDLRGSGRPVDEATGRSDGRAAGQLCLDALARSAEAVTLNLSGKGPPWGDGETASLVAALLEQPEAVARLSGVWLHHTGIGDGSCSVLGERLLPAAASLAEIHISDSMVTAEGVRSLALAAQEVAMRREVETGFDTDDGGGHGRRAGGRSAKQARLYVNARHLGGDDIEAIAREFAECLIVKYARPWKGDGFGAKGSKGGGSPMGGSGRGGKGVRTPTSGGRGGGGYQGGKGHAGSKGGKGGSWSPVSGKGSGGGASSKGASPVSGKGSGGGASSKGGRGRSGSGRGGRY